MRPRLRAFAAAVLFLLCLAPAARGGTEGRVQGTVTDEAKAPLGGVKVLVSSPEFKFHLERATNEKGIFTLIILDPTRQYTVRLEKEGYAPYEGPLKLSMGDIARPTFELPKQTAQPTAQEKKPAAPSPSDQAVVTYNEGVTALHANDLVTATAKFEQAAQLNPALTPVQGALAEVYLAQKRWPEAAAAAERVLAAAPQDVHALGVRFDAYKGAGDAAKAAAALEAWAQAMPGHDVAVRVFNEGADASRAGKTDAALAQLKRALELDPKLAPAYSALASIYLSHKNYPDAIAMAGKLLEIDPKSLEALTIQHEAYKALKDKAKVKEVEGLMAATKADQSPATLFNHGVALFNANNFPEAKSTFEEVLAAEPNHAKAHYLLGLVFVNSGDNAKAKEHFEKFLELAPNDPDAAAAKEMLKAM